MITTRVPDLTVSTKFTATNTNCLSGTQLETAPTNGKYVVYIASTVNTATVSVSAPGQQAAQDDDVPLFSNGVPPLDQANPWCLKVRAGQKPVVNLGGTTGTVYCITQFFAG